MYYGMLRPSEAVSLLASECELPGEGWGSLEFREVHSAAGREWTDDGEVHEARKPKGGPKNAVRRVPIPPELVRLLREHIESYGTAPDGRLFWTYRGGIYQPSTLWQVLQAFRGLRLHSRSTRLGSFPQVNRVWPGQVGRPQQDSNLRSRLRRPLLSPLSYGGYATLERVPANEPVPDTRCDSARSQCPGQDSRSATRGGCCPCDLHRLLAQAHKACSRSRFA